MRIRVAGKSEDELVNVAGAIVEVQPYLVTVLADTAIRSTALDESEAAEAKKAAEEALANAKSDFDVASAF